MQELGGGFKGFLSIFYEDSHFDDHFENGVASATRFNLITWTHSGVVSGWQALPQCGHLWSRALAVET